MKIAINALLVILSIGAGLLQAQFDFTVKDRKVQIHSFGSQMFAYSDHNSYLTMKTSEGSFGFTDGGVSISAQLTSRLRVGAQAYSRRLGDMSKGQVTLDWAMVDYRINDWFGIRAGKVKTALGLYNDSQDADFVHTWAMLPQSMYPLDLRSATIAHTGGDFYGTVPLRRMGSAAYTAYAGMRPNDPREGYRYFLRDLFPLDKYTGPQGGGDLRWTTPIAGLVAGASFLTQHPSGSSVGPLGRLYQESRINRISQYYGQYTIGHLRLDAEYRRDLRRQIVEAGGVRLQFGDWDARSWYTAAAYRLHRRLEVGSYYSSFVPDGTQDSKPPENHIRDKVVAARVDLTRFWTVKVEGHFIDGYGARSSARGFYELAFPQLGIPNRTMPQTNMLLIRTGFSF